MLRTLLESQAMSSRRGWGTAVSISVHTAAIALAIAATARATAAPTSSLKRSADIIYVAPPPNVTRTRTLSSRHAGTNVLPVFALEHVAPPPVFPTTTAPLSIEFPRPTAEPFGGALRIGLAGPRPGGDSLARAGGAYSSDLVEKVVAPRPGNPAPAYPASLRSAQVEGSVLARFVVDTTGRVEAASINFPEATHALFADAVRQSLLRSRYLPAVLGEHAVRQLVEQRFAFTLTR